MNNMTQEQKAKAYDEARKKIAIRFGSNVADEIFSQFEMSEDERIRKEIITHIKWCKDVGYCTKEEMTRWVAWIEEQANHANFRNKIQIGDKVTKNEDGVLVNLSQLKRVAKKDEKQGEQKSAKVEPKFKEGDWITNNIDTNKIIGIDIKNEDYLFENGVSDISLVDSISHLWTIQDAKDGDVLYINNTMSESIMIYKSYDFGIINKYASYNKFGFEGEHYLTLNDGYIIPATKEQRDLLFQKMKEAGYEWDGKELKKIEQTSAWSEEDEDYLKEAIENCYECGNNYIAQWLKSLKDRVQPQPKQEWSEEDEEEANYIADFIENLIKKEKLVSKKTMIMEEMVDWLKSIKERVQPQNRWKPDKAVIQILELIIQGKANPTNYQATLMNLVEQLKKLKS